MNFKNIILGFIIVVGLFLAGRFTAPKSEDLNRQRIIDSLSRNIQIHQKALEESNIKMEILKVQADSLFEEAQKEKKPKIIIRVQHDKDTTRNRKFTVLQRDSLIRTIFYTKRVGTDIP